MKPAEDLSLRSGATDLPTGEHGPGSSHTQACCVTRVAVTSTPQRVGPVVSDKLDSQGTGAEINAKLIGFQVSSWCPSPLCSQERRGGVGEPCASSLRP